MEPSPIKIFPPLLSDKTGEELLADIQKKTGAPGVILVLLTKRMDDSTDDMPGFTSTFTVGIAKKFLPNIFTQISEVMRSGRTKEIG